MDSIRQLQLNICSSGSSPGCSGFRGWSQARLQARQCTGFQQAALFHHSDVVSEKAAVLQRVTRGQHQPVNHSHLCWPVCVSSSWSESSEAVRCLHSDTIIIIIIIIICFWVQVHILMYFSSKKTTWNVCDENSPTSWFKLDFKLNLDVNLKRQYSNKAKCMFSVKEWCTTWLV